MPLDQRRTGRLIASGTVEFKANRSTIEQARLIARTLGTRRAASYLARRGWSIEAATWAIIGDRASLFTHTPNRKSLFMDTGLFRTTDLYKAMQACGDYETDDDILDELACMLEEVDSGHDPEDVLLERGFEPDCVFDLLGQY